MDVLSIQTRLKAMGYDPGPLDGDFGPRTAAAIKVFETMAKLPADGQIDAAFTAALFANVKPIEPLWMIKARAMLGVQEGKGDAESPDVLQMFADAGHPEVKHDSTPWCAAFVGAMLHRAGIVRPPTLWALDYLKFGVALPGPILGAIAVKTRAGGGHVTFVAGADGDRVFVLGGNQADAVNVASYPRSVFAYRYPAEAAIPKPAWPLPRSIAGARAGLSEA